MTRFTAAQLCYRVSEGTVGAARQMTSPNYSSVTQNTGDTPKLKAETPSASAG